MESSEASTLPAVSAADRLLSQASSASERVSSDQFHPPAIPPLLWAGASLMSGMLPVCSLSLGMLPWSRYLAGDGALWIVGRGEDVRVWTYTYPVRDTQGACALLRVLMGCSHSACVARPRSSHQSLPQEEGS